MKKRTHKLLSILLALTMVLGMLPAMSLTAFAAEPGISLSGADSSGEGWSYVESSQTLTLNNYDGGYIQGSGLSTLNLVLEGTNIITVDDTNAKVVHTVRDAGDLWAGGQPVDVIPLALVPIPNAVNIRRLNLRIRIKRRCLWFHRSIMDNGSIRDIDAIHVGEVNDSANITLFINIAHERFDLLPYGSHDLI